MGSRLLVKVKVVLTFVDMKRSEPRFSGVKAISQSPLSLFAFCRSPIVWAT